MISGAVLALCSASALAALNVNDPLPLSPLLKKGKLDNGLTYYIQQNQKPEHRVELRLVVKAGSILEDDDQQGLAHFLEHMAFNGSEHFKRSELISYLQSIGVKFGADLNAATGFDETTYFLPIPTDKKENLETGFLVLQDWAQGLTLNDADIDTERPIVLEEARLGKGASDRMRKVLLPEIFNGSRYADRLPIGKEELIKSFPYSAVKRFYHDWYRPDLMAVIVVGDVDPAQAEAMIRAHFSQLRNPANERPRTYAPVPARQQSAGLIVTDKEATNNMVMLRYPVSKKTPELTYGDYRQHLIESLNRSMLNQRLLELTQQATPPFLGAGSGNEGLAPGYRSFTSNLVVGKAGFKAGIAAVVQENERARQFGFREDEFERARKNLLRAYENSYNERDKTNSSNFAGEFTRNFLVGETIPGIAAEYEIVKELLAGIKLEDVNRYTKDYIPHDTKKLVAYLGSDQPGEPLPGKEELLNLVQTAEHAQVLAGMGKALPKTLMTQPPKAGSIVSETTNQALGTTEIQLSNGLKVIVKPSDFKSDQILLSASRFGGQSLFGDADTYNARYASSVVQLMGMGDFTPLEIQKILAGKSFSVSSGVNTYTENISAASTRQDLETMFQALYLRLLKQHHDADLYQAFISNAQEATKNAMVRPEAVFSDVVNSTLFKQHPRIALTARPEDFSRLNLPRMEEIYQQRFTSMKGFTFVVTGSVDMETLRPLLTTYIASLPTPDIVTSYRDLGIRPVSGVVKKEVFSGTEPKSDIQLVFTGLSTYSKEENLRFNALMEVMNLRIVEVLREKMSLIYTGSMRGSLERIPYQHYQIVTNLPCGPENVERVLNAILAEINKLKAEGPQQSELDKVRQNWIKNYRIGMRTNEQWLNQLLSASLFNTDPGDILTVEERVNSLTVRDVQGAAKRYFDTGNYLQAVLYPEKKTEQAEASQARSVPSK